MVANSFASDQGFESNGYQVTSENELDIKKSEVLIFSVGPRDLEPLLKSEKNNFYHVPQTNFIKNS